MEYAVSAPTFAEIMTTLMKKNRTKKGQKHPKGSIEPRKKTEPTFYYTGWLIGILIMVYYNAL